MLPLPFIRFSRNEPQQVHIYPAAITGGSCRSLVVIFSGKFDFLCIYQRFGALLGSHVRYSSIQSLSAFLRYLHRSCDHRFLAKRNVLCKISLYLLSSSMLLSTYIVRLSQTNYAVNSVPEINYSIATV